MNSLIKLRMLGSGLVIAAYFIILHSNMIAGVLTHITAMGISTPYFIRSKAWDVVIMFIFLMSIGMSKLIILIPR